MLSSEEKSKEIFWKQYFTGIFECIAFISAHPFHLGCGEAGKDNIARDRPENRVCVHLGCFDMAAGVIPQHTGSKWGII